VEVVAVRKDRLQTGRLHSGAGASTRRRAFTLIDLLVSMMVIAVLVGILLPSLANVHEAARRTVCASNLRQIGFGVASFADERGGRLPPSQYKNRGISEEMMTLRIGADANAGRPLAQWDGLGLLHAGGFLLGPKVYYCPSHHGTHPFQVYVDSWRDESQDFVVGNYQYRGMGRDGVSDLFRITPSRTALVSDGLRTLNDYNHVIGANVLRADLSTAWVDDRSTNTGVRSLLVSTGLPDEAISSTLMDTAWRRLDEADPTQ
jgi:competence protein ComGC